MAPATDAPRSWLHWISWTLGVVAILFVLYVLSAGPAVYLVVRTNQGERLLRAVYSPLVGLPKMPLTVAFYKYTDWCAETAARHAELR